MEKLMEHRRKSSLTQQTAKLTSESNGTQLDNELVLHKPEGRKGKRRAGAPRGLSSEMDGGARGGAVQPFQIVDMPPTANDVVLHQTYADLKLQPEFQNEARQETGRGECIPSPTIERIQKI